jgi:hypothetical protein
MTDQYGECVFKTILGLLLVELIGLGFGLVGMILGATISGNLTGQINFSGLVGYKAAGQIGFLLTVVIGLVAGWTFLMKRRGNNSLFRLSVNPYFP